MKDAALITGASGLLGSAMAALWGARMPVTALGHAHAGGAVRAVDLLDARALATLADEAWTVLIHCAAFRSPDYCEAHPAAARALNVAATARLADLAAARGATMIYISTDYVFDGARPPYREDDATNPVNEYGRTKLAGERAVLERAPGALVLRIPALYGDPPPPLRGGLFADALDAARGVGAPRQEHVLLRHPTFTEDVAETAWQLWRGRHAGVSHVSAGAPATRYELAVFTARALGVSAAHLMPVADDPARTAPRPANSKLAVDRLTALGLPVPRDYTAGFRLILQRRGLMGGDAQL